MQKKLTYSFLALSVLIFTGCGGGSGDTTSQISSDNIYKLSPQKDTRAYYLFYGENNAKSLGSLKNVYMVDPQNPTSPLLNAAINSNSRYPLINSSFEYNATTGTYSNFKLDSVSYVSDTTAYSFSLQKRAQNSRGLAAARQNSKESNLTKPSFIKLSYLGSKNYVTATDAQGNSLLITPEMNKTASPLQLADKKLLTLTYPSYGAAIDGYLMYDNATQKVQKCSLDLTQCQDILDAGSRDFEGDIGGTTYALFVTDGTVYRVDKRDGSKEEVSLEGKEIATGHGTTSFQGSSFYFIATDGNLYRVDALKQKLTQITPTPDNTLERIRAFTNDWVIYGSDTIIKAAKKDGTTKEPILLVETTKTKGYKYVTNFGIDDKYLFVTYSVDPKTAQTTYKACIFDGKAPECKNNSFWAAIIPATSGKLNFESSYPYTPFAYVRVDDTDSFGGGTLKAIDPAHPFADGIAMGKAPEYNFQTFLSNYRYFTDNLDSNGSIVLYAKNDNTFHVDAFYMNLFQENSLIQLTDTDPFPDVTTGRDHCHGRHCMICHNLAGGKIYQDKNGTKSAYGYRVRLDFENGTSVTADVAKGKGENFSLPLKTLLAGNFKANIIDQNGTVINHSVQYYHEGVASANCNFCHGRNGNLRFDAPSVITIEK